MKGKESLVDDKLSLLNSNWKAVTSRAEEWFNLLLVRKMHFFTQRKCWFPVVRAQIYKSAFSGALDCAYWIHRYTGSQIDCCIVHCVCFENLIDYWVESRLLAVCNPLCLNSPCIVFSLGFFPNKWNEVSRTETTSVWLKWKKLSNKLSKS